MPPDAESSEVINAILSPAAAAPAASEAGGEAPARSPGSPSRGADGRFAPVEQEAAEADDEPADGEVAPETAEAEEEAPEEQEQPEQAVPENLDDYTVEVVVDGQPAEVTLRELKQSYSGTQYIAKQVQQAVEYRKQQEQIAQQSYAALEHQVQHLQAIQEVWNKFANPQIDLEQLRARDPQAYALKRIELIDAQEKAQKIQQEISAKQAQQAQIEAQRKAQRVEEETRTLLQKLPALADPQKAPVVMGKIREVAQSYGVTDDELNALDGHVPVLILAELAWRREQMAETEARLKRPTGDQPRPKTLIRPGTAQPAQSSEKKLRAELINRAKKSGKPDDVAATLLVSRKRA
jgi:acylphosphatase